MAFQTISGRPLRRQVAFVGPLGVGKSTAVHMISDLPVVRTEAGPQAVNDDGTRVARRLREHEGSDYGEWSSAPGGPVAVVAAPGQARFATTRRSALVRATCVVLWLYGHTEYALEEAEEWLRYLAPELEDTPLVLAVTRLEIAGDRPALEDYRRVVDRWSPGARLISADPRDRDSVREVLEAALAAQVRPRRARAAR